MCLSTAHFNVLQLFPRFHTYIYGHSLYPFFIQRFKILSSTFQVCFILQPPHTTLSDMYPQQTSTLSHFFLVFIIAYILFFKDFFSSIASFQICYPTFNSKFSNVVLVLHIKYFYRSIHHHLKEDKTLYNFVKIINLLCYKILRLSYLKNSVFLKIVLTLL